MKRVSEYLDTKNIDRGTKLNLLFYLGTYVASSALKSVKPQRHRLAKMNVTDITDAMLDSGYSFIHAGYVALGGDDKAAKGPDLIIKVKAELRKLFAKKK